MSTMLSTSSGRASAHSWWPHNRIHQTATADGVGQQPRRRQHPRQHRQPGERMGVQQGAADRRRCRRRVRPAGRRAGAPGRWPTGTTRCRWSAPRTGSARRAGRSACPTRRAARRPAWWSNPPTGRRSSAVPNSWLDAWWSITSTCASGLGEVAQRAEPVHAGNVDRDHQIGVAAHGRRARPAGGRRAASAATRAGRRSREADLDVLARPLEHQRQRQAGADGVGVGIDVAHAR